MLAESIAYAFLLRGTWPDIITQLGIGLLIIGVVWAVRIRPERIDIHSAD